MRVDKELPIAGTIAMISFFSMLAGFVAVALMNLLQPNLLPFLKIENQKPLVFLWIIAEAFLAIITYRDFKEGNFATAGIIAMTSFFSLLAAFVLFALFNILQMDLWYFLRLGNLALIIAWIIAETILATMMYGELF